MRIQFDQQHKTSKSVHVQHEQFVPGPQTMIGRNQKCRVLIAGAAMTDIGSTASVDTGQRLTAKLESLLPLSISQSRFGMASERQI